TTTEVRTPGTEATIFEGRKTTITRVYEPVDLTDWYLGRVKDVTTVSEATGQATVTRKAAFTYRTTGDQAMVKSIVQDPVPEEPGPEYQDIMLELVADFDPFGNIKKVTMTGKVDATVSQTRVHETRWDAQGRFPY